MFTQEQLKAIIDHFTISGEFVRCVPISDGHINTTFQAVFRNRGRELNYLLQQINTAVFKKPDELMINIDLVTSFLRDLTIRSRIPFCSTRPGTPSAISRTSWRISRSAIFTRPSPISTTRPAATAT